MLCTIFFFFVFVHLKINRKNFKMDTFLLLKKGTYQNLIQQHRLVAKSQNVTKSLILKRVGIYFKPIIK